MDNTEKYINGWVAKNKGKSKDLQDMSFFNTKEQAQKCFGNRQEYIPVRIVFLNKGKGNKEK